MIRKLRWKFVAVCMGLVALVLSAVFGAAYHAVRQNIEDLSRQMLYQVLREDSGRGAVPNPTIEIGGDRVLLPYFTVNIWGDTAYITGGTYADLENTDTLRDILSQCLEQGAAEGTVSEYHLRYLSMDNGLYRKLAFVDMSMEQAVLRRLVRSYLLIALGAMLVLLGIAAAASRWVTRPVEKAWKQQRQFLSDASHELKTPVTILKGQLAGMLEGVGVYQDRDKYLLRSLQTTGRMERLIGEMLSISRMESGSAAVRQEPVDLSALMAQQLALDRELLEQRGQQLVSALTPGITVPADASLLGKAVGNLLSNASRYSPEGAEIRVWCGRLEGRPALSVENTGARISGDALPHLFEAFYREEGSRNRSTGGSGLGLYLVKMILERHGATCTIENTPEGVRASVRFLEEVS